MDFIKRSLISRLNRMARLVELQASTNVLINEMKLIDFAFIRLINKQPSVTEQVKRFEEQATLLGRLRDRTSDGHFRVSEQAALTLLVETAVSIRSKAVIDHCEAQKCEWLKAVQEEDD